MTGKHLIFLKFMETGFIHKCGRDLCSLIKVYAIFIHRHRLLSTNGKRDTTNGWDLIYKFCCLLLHWFFTEYTAAVVLMDLFIIQSISSRWKARRWILWIMHNNKGWFLTNRRETNYYSLHYSLCVFSSIG